MIRYGSGMYFAAGQSVLRRYFRHDRYTWIQPMRVITDDAAGLLLWHSAGSDLARLVDADGNTQHELPLDLMRDPRFVTKTWDGGDILVLMPPAAVYSVWWFFDHDTAEFQGWYINLEDPYRRLPDGVDTTDLVLDIQVAPDRTWHWKDEDEFAARTGHPLYFDTATAAAIRAEGERLLTLVEAGGYPFDGTHTDFRPDPAWPPQRLPTGWHRTHRTVDGNSMQ